MTSIAQADLTPDSRQSGKIRVMVVDDSAVVRGLVSRWIDEDPETETCGRFHNGRLAIDGVVRSAPDVIILDIEMPVMDGLAALPELLERMPGVRVIMASTLTRKNAEISLKALSLGATDYIPKPERNSGITTSVEFRDELLRKVKAVVPRKSPAAAYGRQPATESPAGVATRIRPGGEAAPAAAKATYTLRAFSNVKPRILAIGSSTGGPQALASLVETIAPALGDVPVVITQHMPPTFTSILAQRLGRSAGLPSREGVDGLALVPGTIYVAPGGMHMMVAEKNGSPVLQVRDGPLINYCKPSVEPLFASVSKVYGPAVLALVLTGMGHDGAAGSKLIADAGGTVIAQDQATSVVWGMPGAAAAAGACAAVLPLDEIGPKTSSLLRGDGR